MNGRFEVVEVVKKVNLGLLVTHNRDGQFQKIWALGADGQVYRTSSYGGCYKPMQAHEVAPPALLQI